MQFYSETIFQQLSGLVDILGYSLMLGLAFIMWWGINSGGDIILAQAGSETYAGEKLHDLAAVRESSATLQRASMWVDTDKLSNTSDPATITGR